MSTKSKIVELSQAQGDPKKAITDMLGDLSKLEIYGQRVLVATYIRPEKTKSGIFLPQKTVGESQFQGKCALVVAKGPGAFVNDGGTDFHGQNVNVGDWVVIRPSDGWEMWINGVSCRMVDDVLIKARIPHPDYVW